MSVDKSVHTKVVSFLKHLGLTPEETAAYLYLLQYGPQTVLSLSRGLKTGRTKLYPLLETLAAKQLVHIHERHYGTSYEAQPPTVLEFLVSEHERKASALRSSLSAAVHSLTVLSHESPRTSRLVEYRGVDGLKQMNWNLTKAQEKFYVFELAHLHDHLGTHFAEKMRSVFTERAITSYDLTNNQDWALQTNVPNYATYSKARYIDPAIFTIQFETYIYNNCVALLSYERDDIFGIEIYNDKLANQQKQLYELLWSQAKPLA